MESPNILSYGTCPNCQSNNFIIEKRICLDCWYSLEHNNVELSNKFITWEIKENLSTKIKKKKLKVKKYNFESYEVWIQDNKLLFIKFKIFSERFWEQKFFINIDYQIKHKEIDEIEFYETDPEERIHHLETTKIKLAYPRYIFEKAKNWYKERKNINYYKQINQIQLNKFIEEVIKNFHKII